MKLGQQSKAHEAELMLDLALCWACEGMSYLGCCDPLGCRDSYRLILQSWPDGFAAVAAWLSNPVVYREDPSSAPWCVPISYSARMSGVLSWSQSPMRGRLGLKLQWPMKEFHG